MPFESEKRNTSAGEPGLHGGEALAQDLGQGGAAGGREIGRNEIGHGIPHAPRRRGSSVSRRASPSRFDPNTAKLMAIPGTRTRCGAFCAYSAADTESIR